MLFSVFLVLSACTPAADKEHRQELNELRSKKDAYFKYGDHSPLREQDQADFRGLNYFDPDSRYKTEAKVHLLDDPGSLEVEAAGTGSKVRFHEIARLEFTLLGDTYSLMAYEVPRDLASLDSDENVLFIPFRDASNGITTHTEGRYIDMKWRGEKSIMLDFNKAYTPFCRYNDEFVCPEAPDENNLDFVIEAGEKKW